MKIFFYDSLSKEACDREVTSGITLKNQSHFLGITLTNHIERARISKVTVKGLDKKFWKLYRKDNVPLTIKNGTVECDDYIDPDTSLVPDVLSETNGIDNIIPLCGKLNFLLKISPCEEMLPVGDITISVFAETEKGEKDEKTYTLTVLDRELEKSDFRVTQWIHYDCIVDYHKCRPFSKRFYEILKSYFATAVEYGQTMVYVPLFTAPLDTRIGSERTTCQLVDVKKTDAGYEFGFDKVKYFIEFALASGFKYLEFSHLFTQWGALHAPKIIAEVNGKNRRIFGWETDSAGEESLTFIRALLTKLTAFINENGWHDISHFHVSDEPSAEALERYSVLRDVVRESIGDIHIMDALSNYEFYQRGLVSLPVPVIDRIAPFVENNVTHMAYYCCCPNRENYTNRFLILPLHRVRILGLLLYRNNAIGFLHWGYNFYNSFLSVHKIDPYRCTDGAGSFPSGDSFVVYPVENGCTPSARLVALGEGFNDYHLLKMLEAKKGRDYVMALLESEGVHEGYNNYPFDAAWHMDFMNRVTKEISE